MIIETVVYDEIQYPCVYEDGDFSLYIEDNTIGWILHGYVYNWKPSTYKKILSCILDVLDEAPHSSLFVISDNDKLTKFASMFGMEVIDTFMDSKGNQGDLLCLTL